MSLISLRVPDESIWLPQTDDRVPTPTGSEDVTSEVTTWLTLRNYIDCKWLSQTQDPWRLCFEVDPSPRKGIIDGPCFLTTVWVRWRRSVSIDHDPAVGEVVLPPCNRLRILNPRSTSWVNRCTSSIMVQFKKSFVSWRVKYSGF